MEKPETCNFDTTIESKSEAEVFVLPPELLAKLGINLSNIQHPQLQLSTTSPVKETSQIIDHNSNPSTLPECRDVSSIIETANLMKESVFLSPTFLQTASNATLEEEPINVVDNESVNVGESISLKSCKIPYSHTTNAVNNTKLKEITCKLLHESTLINSNEGISVNQVDDLGVFESIKEYQVENQDGNLILTDIPYQGTGDAQIANENSKTTSHVDEHPEEAYLSDYSNNYSRRSPESFASVVDKQNSLNKKKDLYKEVPRDLSENTEEINRKCSLSNQPAITSSAAIEQKVHTNSNDIEHGKLPKAISIEQFIIEHPVINCNKTIIDDIHESPSVISSKNFISWTPAEQKGNELKMTKIDYDNHHKSVIYVSDSVDTENQSKNKNMIPINHECAQKSEKKSSEKSLKVNDELLSSEKMNINYTDEIMKIPQHYSDDARDEKNIISRDSLDKVKEIAAYLSQCANERNNIIKNKNFYKEKKTKVDPFKSKLNFSGVEKLDGKLIQKDMKKCSKVLRTYQRTINRKQIPDLVNKSCKIITTDLFQLPINDNIEEHDCKVTLKSQNDFCICNDFGNLAYYDCEMLYEHIHFWPHTKINCDLEILYSIYNDEYSISNQNIDKIQDGYQNEHNEDEISRDNLCWNELNIKRKCDKILGSSINYDKTSGEAHSSNEQKTLGKTVHHMTSEIVINKADKDVDKIAKKEINCPSILKKSRLIKPTKQYSSIFANSKKDLTSVPAQENSSESDMSMMTLTKEFTNIDKEIPPKSTRKTTTEVESNSKCSRFSESSDMEALSQTIDNALYAPSPSKKIRKDIAVHSTKNNSNTDVTPKISERSSKMNLLMSTKANSDIEIALKYKETATNIHLEPIVNKCSLSTASNVLPDTSSNTYEALPLKTTISLSREVTNTTINSSEINTNTKTDTSVPTSKLPGKNVPLNNLIIKSKEIDATFFTEIKDFQKAISVSTRSTRSCSVIDIESPPSLIKSVNGLLDTGIHSKLPRDTTSSSSSISVFSDGSRTANIDSSKADKYTPTPIIGSDRSSKVTNTSVFTAKTIKPLESATSLSLLKHSAYNETCESSESRKISTNTVTVDSSLKKITTMEMANAEMEIFRNDSIVKNTENRKINDQTNDTKMSSVIEVLDDKILNSELNNDVISTTISRMNEVTSAIENKRCESTEGRGQNSDKSNTINLIEIEVPLKCTVPLPQSTDIAIVESVESVTSKELSPKITLNNSQTTNKNYDVVIEIESSSGLVDKIAKCGVCAKSVEESLWIEHIFKEHHYLAWRDSEPALNLENEAAVKSHLQVIARENDGLICSKCGLVRKLAKPFLRHVKNCNGYRKDELDSSQEQDDDILLNSRKSREQRKPAVTTTVTCGVCSKTMEDSKWIEHIQVEHKYLAWSAEETPLNLDDEDEVKNHLNYISKNYGGLICNKCGSKWNYVKKYLIHQSLCDNSALIKKETNNRKERKEKIEVEFSPVVTCGICKLDVEGRNWLKHIQLAHQYLAWIDGEKPLDVDNYEEVKAHLTKVIKMTGELICMKCGISRVYPRAYILHTKACTNSGFEMQITEPASADKGKFVCAVCHQQGKMKHWKEHAMKNHYNVAWMVGEVPINIRNFYAVEKYLKEYHKKNSLVCNHCRTSRTSCYGFYAHVLTCGKTDEEIDAVHNLCDICNKKYLCVYRNQHIASHRDSEHRKEMRELKAQQAAEEAVKPQEQKEDQPTGKRKAAEKAKKVIKKYSSNVVDGKPVCPCGATFGNAEELSQHNCTLNRNTEDDDSDVSVKMEPESEVESDGTDIDSTVSDIDEEEQKKKKRHRVGEGSTKITRMSYRVNDYNSYLAQGYRDFSKLHYTSESLFNEWRSSEYDMVPANEMQNYLPSLTESCKIRFGSSGEGEWITYKRFESKKIKGYSMFTGGAIQCMSWASPNISDETLDNYLAVYTHQGPDVPRHGVDELPVHPALVQIWDFQQFNFLPKCVLTLALDYGIVWAMDWCPSGGRDQYVRDGSSVESRLGLLAIACSNGTAYILAVPYPPAETKDEPVMCRPKIVAELRLSMTAERRVYQATCIKWSQQKGHETIVVGYSDGTTAFYDVNTESPFLKSTENGVTIFYPYQDKQSENSAITGVGVCVSTTEGYSSGGYFSASLTGATLGAWPRPGPSARVHSAAAQATHSPHWPAVIISGDVPFMKGVTEVEWWGGGRRTGASRAACACARCGRVAAAAAPALRLHRAHPCYPDIKKLIIATLLMVPVGRKRKRKVNDDISMVVEPLTYEHAVEKYGLQFNLVPKNDQAAAQQLCNDNELCPERFPLSDIVAVAFCPSSRFHDKLAVATHTGLIFIINA